jgi:hypothetical protein
MYVEYCARFEVFTAMTMKIAVFWDVSRYSSCKNRCFRGTNRLHHQGDKKLLTRSTRQNIPEDGIFICSTLVGNLEGKILLGVLGTGRWIILKWISE